MSYTQKRVSRRRGVVAVLVAACLVVLVMFVAIVVDGGIVQDRRRHLQAATDSAAMAAAAQLFMQDPATQGMDPQNAARDSARAIAAANGYGNDGTTSIVTVNIPPTSGPFNGQRNYAEVTIEYRQQRYFSGVFGTGNLPIKARAVSRGKWAPPRDGIIVLDKDERGALTIDGGGTQNVTALMTNAPVIVNSSDSEAMIANGSASMTASEGFELTGGSSTSGGGVFNGPISTGWIPTPDPLRYLPPPDPSTLTVQSYNHVQIAGNQTVTLQPGVYIGGITITGQAQVVLEPGIYYMQDGGFSFNGLGSLQGIGVMIYNAPGASTSNLGIDVTGGGSVTLSPMTSGPYAGIVFFQDRNADVPVDIKGNGNMNITGTFYAANAPIRIDGNGAISVGSQFISRTLTLGGNGAVNVNYDPALAPKRRIYQMVQ